MWQTYATGFENTFTKPFGAGAITPQQGDIQILAQNHQEGKSKLQINFYLNLKTGLITISIGSKLFNHA